MYHRRRYFRRKRKNLTPNNGVCSFSHKMTQDWTSGICAGYLVFQTGLDCPMISLSTPKKDVPHWANATELTDLLGRYTRFKLQRIFWKIHSFRFFNITAKCMDPSISQDKRTMVATYIFDRFANSNIATGVNSFKGFQVDIQELNSCPVEMCVRHTFSFSDVNWAFNDILSGDYQQPTRKRTLYPTSKIICTYYPVCRNYIDTRLFWSDGTFIKWLSQMSPCKPVHAVYMRCANNFTSIDAKDMNFFQMTYCSFKTDCYYNFRFAGMHNLDYM